MARRSKKYGECECRAGYEAGIVLDPFMGSGTTALVARELGRRYVGIDLNPEYCRMARKRLKSSTRILRDRNGKSR
jgi:site-specific DNA-methyltransferase (adenine-specific)